MKRKYTIVVGSVIFNKENRVLLAKRLKTDKSLPGCWGLPGGKVEFEGSVNDILEKEVRREIKEEVGIEVKNLLYIESHSHKSGKIHIAFMSDLKSGTPKALDETDEVKWFNLNEVKKLKLTPHTLKRVKRACELRKSNFIHYPIGDRLDFKPEKVIYDNQEQIHDQIANFIKSKLPEEVTEAILFGSVVERTFGKYAEKYGSHEGSDIDLMVIIKNDKIPVDWKYLNVSKDWWYLYRGWKIRINDTTHKTDILVVKDGKEEFAINRVKEKKWRIERIK